MKGWRPALRLAWRDAWKAKGRSILVLVMIALPVLAVTAAAVVQATSDLDDVEAIERTMGAAQARIQPVGGVVVQAPARGMDVYNTTEEGPRPSMADLDDLLGEREVISIAQGHADVELGDRNIQTAPTEVDLRNPLAEGLFELSTGDLPAQPGEGVINDALAERGVAIGDTVDVLGQEITVVGVGRDASWRGIATITALPGSFGHEFAGGSGTGWLVGGDELLWPAVQELNGRGAVVYSRAVIEDPPPAGDTPEFGSDGGSGDVIAVAALVVSMALLEVVLLAGPAFAVGARRQARTLALMAACGGTPRQARRVVLASGVVLGALAALLGAVLGVMLGMVLVPVVQRFSDVWFGSVDIDWRVVAIVSAFGLLSALLAAVVPAWLASKQDVVAVLAGRRGDAPPSARTPIIGLVLLGVGIALSVVGASGSRYFDNGEFGVALGAVVAVFGMIFVVPLVVSVLARFSGRLPLAMRYAARDAARHRTRTVPAVAAVAATVAGVVALGIANSSDEAENRETYVPSIAMGAASVNVDQAFESSSGRMLPVPAGTWERVRAAVRERLPEAEPEVLRGQMTHDEDGSYYLDVVGEDGEPVHEDWGPAPSNAAGLVSDGAVPGIFDVDGATRDRMADALRAGRAVVLSTSKVDSDTVTVNAVSYSEEQQKSDTEEFTWPAEHIQVTERQPAQLLLPTALAEEAGPPVTTVGLYLPDERITEAEEKDLNETLGAINENATMYVERGYQPAEEALILLLILFTLGGLLMLGGTLTTTFLALSDARPDLATLAAVGAAPRSRRGVAASYALVVGLVGAVLGAMVGFIPGVAISIPLTSLDAGTCVGGGEGPMVCDNGGPYLDIPWLLIMGLVVVLPLLTALIMGLTARSRLPLASRLT